MSEFKVGHDIVTDVAIYPGKSFQLATVDGERPVELDVGPAGVEVYGVRDRDFVLAYGDSASAAFVSQRGWGAGSRKVQYPEDRSLATIAVDVRPDHVAFTAPKFGKLEVATQLSEGPGWTVNVFGKEFFGIDQGAEAGNFFTRFLHGSGGSPRDIHLLRADRARPRYLPERYQRPDASNQVSGADGMPLLFASQESLDALHIEKDLRLGTVAIGRYRPNIIILGHEWGAWAEDKMNHIEIGHMGAYVVKACSRCPIPNTNQRTGEYDGASSRLLGSRAGHIFTGETGVFFGQNLNHVYDPDRPIKVGIADSVRVISWAEEPNVKLRAG